MKRQENRRPIQLVACLLAITTALTLLATAEALRPSRLVLRGPADPALVAVAQDFYAAVNRALGSGDVTAMTALVSPQFVEHPTQVGIPSGRAGFVQAVLGLRETAPAFRLTVETAIPSAGGDQVTIRLRTTGTGAGSFLGLGTPPELKSGGWGPLEVLRIQDYQIAERWSGQDASALLQPLAQTTMSDADPSTPRLLGLIRLTFAPYATTIVDGFASRLITAETGAISVTKVEPLGAGPTPLPGELVPESPPVPAEWGLTLAAGESHFTPPGADVLVTNPTASPATLLLVLQFGTSWGMTSDYEPTGRIWIDAAALERAEPAGVTADVLAFAVVPAVHQATLAIGQVTLAPNTTLTWPPTDATVMLACDQEQLSLTTTSERTRGTTAGRRSWRGASTTMSPGDGAVLASETGASWVASGDESTVVLMIVLTARTGEPATIP